MKKTPTLEEINALTDDLLAVRTLIESHEGMMKKLKLERGNIQDTLIGALQAVDIKSIKRAAGTVSVAVRKGLRINDEGKLISWLKGKKLDKEYVEERVSAIFKRTVAPQLIKEKQTPDGMELVESSYISIRNSK